MRGFLGFISVLCFILLIVALLFTCVQAVVMDRDFFEREYYLMGTARALGVDHDALMDATDKLLKYIDGKEDSLKFKISVQGHKVDAFGERERDHMVDVRALYENFRTFRNFCAPLAAALLLIIALILRRDVVKLMCKCYTIAACVFTAFFGGLVAWMAVDFNSFWNAFHTVFFTNDLWILDPASSLMIRMFPLPFWFDMVMRILVIFGACVGALLVACVIYLAYHAYRKRSLLVVRGDGR